MVFSRIIRLLYIPTRVPQSRLYIQSRKRLMFKGLMFKGIARVPRVRRLLVGFSSSSHRVLWLKTKKRKKGETKKRYLPSPQPFVRNRLAILALCLVRPATGFYGYTGAGNRRSHKLRSRTQRCAMVDTRAIRRLNRVAVAAAAALWGRYVATLGGERESECRTCG